jgi:hypothetical protein
MQGPLTLRSAVAVGEQDPYALADDAFADLPVLASLGGGRLGLEGSMLSVSGAEVSSVRRVAGGALEVRVFNPRGATATVEMRRGTAETERDGSGSAAPTALRGQLVDLRGRFTGSFEGGFELGPYRIATARLTDT